jgi:hypothetical protein
LNKLEQFLEGDDCMRKFALSLLIVKEMCKKNPMLNDLTKKIIFENV